MSNTSSSALRIATSGSANADVKARKQFNRLIEKLDVERKRLAEWHEKMPLIYAKASGELAPLREKEWEQKKALALMLDRQHGHKALTHNQRDKLSAIIGSLLTELLSEREDEELAAICDSGNEDGEGFDDAGELDAYARDRLLDMISKMYGIELDPELSVSGTEDQVRQAFEKVMHERYPDEDRFGSPEADAKAGRSKKTSARAQRHEAEVAKLQQSVRDIFRKLTSALHPDREQDPDERTRKTALMQRVNVAYAANDLLALLELQLEVDQIDAASLDRLDDARIKQYNKVLQKQLYELQGEVAMYESALLRDLDLPMWNRPTPASVDRELMKDIGLLRAEVERIARDVVSFEDIKQLKAWLNKVRLAPPPPMFMDPFWD